METDSLVRLDTPSGAGARMSWASVIPPRMKLTRAHGLGNVYLVLDEGRELTPKLVIALCDSAIGVGSDGILEPVAAQGADHGVRIWNPDGSIAEKSGNGLRIFARWLADRDAGERFTIWTGFDCVNCEVNGLDVVIDMGQATVDPEKVPVLAAMPLIGSYLGELELPYPAVVVGIGNPHCVLFIDEPIEEVPWESWGPQVETYRAFPNRTNVQFVWITPSRIDIRIWERGAGVTPASGSSACAVAVAAVLMGERDYGDIVVHAPGGALTVTVNPNLDVRLRGPVEMVGTLEIDERWLLARTWQRRLRPVRTKREKR